MTDDDPKTIFERAISLRSEGRFVDAVAELAHLLSIAADHKVRCVAMGEMGGILYYDLKDCQKAVEVLKECTAMCPRAELPSLYLFYALTDLRRFAEAMIEAERFMSLRPSSEYRRLMREIASGGSGGDV